MRAAPANEPINHIHHRILIGFAFLDPQSTPGGLKHA
jgi:hypothetical protein